MSDFSIKMFTKGKKGPNNFSTTQNFQLWGPHQKENLQICPLIKNLATPGISFGQNIDPGHGQALGKNKHKKDSSELFLSNALPTSVDPL